MYKKSNARTTYKSGRRPNFKKTGSYQNFKGRNRGNVTQQYNKYLKLAKEALRSGDRGQSEYYYQFTDHYYRLMVELGINIEENVNSSESKNSSTDGQISENESSSINQSEELKSVSTNEDVDESIESIPFIAEPSKEKRSRSTK